MAKWVGLGPKEVITRQHFVYFQPESSLSDHRKTQTLVP